MRTVTQQHHHRRIKPKDLSLIHISLSENFILAIFATFAQEEGVRVSSPR
ncbi:hypothetical protein E2C01_084181 [Portunus trituberculatus]|uniref:Uncharacterized protein n=1 Tax=Portunus trituberculatus TaxID=210409 RepID=A0A5B7JA07_PORTR|nr:hypothetical protein [Portunus trituberculatus]